MFIVLFLDMVEYRARDECSCKYCTKGSHGRSRDDVCRGVAYAHAHVYYNADCTHRMRRNYGVLDGVSKLNARIIWTLCP